MLRKLIKWVLGLALLLAVIVFIALPLLASTDAGRKQLARLMSNAFDREVTIGGLDVKLFWRGIDVADLRIANPEGYPDGSMIEARELHMDASLKKLIGGTLKSGLSGNGLKLHIIKKDGKTNLDGFVSSKKAETGEQGKIPDMDLSLDLSGGQLVIEDLDKGERLDVTGVSTKMRLTNMSDVTTAGLTITVASVDNKTLRVRDLVLDSKLNGDFLEITELSAILPGKGTLGGSGRMRVREGGDWTLNLEMKNVGIDGDMMPFVASVYPLAATAGGQVDGILGGAFQLKGRGLTWEAIKPNLAGTGKVTLRNLKLPQQSIVSQLVSLAGGGSNGLAFNAAGAEFRIADGWLHFNRLSASGQQRFDLAGKVSLDKQLALEYDLMPLVKRFGGGKTYKEAAKLVEKLPVGILGTADAPKIRAPRPEDIAKGAIRKGLGGLIDKLGK